MKVFKKVTSLFLAALLTLSALAVVPFTAAAEEASDAFDDLSAEVFEVGSYADLLAFAAASVEANDYLAGKIVKLTADIDMTEKAWTPIAKFAGTLDGNNHVINGLTVSAAVEAAFFAKLTGNATIKNIAFTNANITNTATSGTSKQAIVAGYSDATTLVFQNVYAGGTVSSKGGYGCGGYIGQAYALTGGTSTVTFNNCVSSVDMTTSSQRNGGFVGLANNKALSFEFTDCVVIGGYVKGSYSAGFVGYSYANFSFTRSVFLGKIASLASGGLFLSEIAVADRVINFTDCYAATQAYDASAYKTNLIAAQHSVSNGTEYYVYADVNMKYGSADAVKVAAKTEALGSQVANIAEAFENNGGYMAYGASATWTKDTFATAYPTLANNGWVATGKTVTFADGMTAPEIMPESVADMITNPATVSYWQVKAGTKENTNDFRFVAKINFADLAAYDEVGYEVTVKVQGNDTPLLNKEHVFTDKVYTSIKAGDDVKLATDLDANYLIALSINGFKNADTTYEVTITPIVKCGTSVIHDADHTVTGTITGNVFTQD